MYLGVDYYPEYWPKEQLDEDINGIVDLGANIVRIGEFSWHLMESTEGHFDFSFYDQLLVKLEQHHLKVMFGTPTATFPAWLANKYPEILGEEKDGQVRTFGGRRQYCYNSHVYQQYAQRITEKLVQHFKNHKTIISWQIDNEFGHEGSDQCYCEQCHYAFIQYLSQKFEGNITRLNDVYGTIFWGQTYNDFTEIPIPKHTITQHNPALLLDWARFRSYSLNSFAQSLVHIVNQHKGEHQTVTHNFPGGFFDNKWYDYAEHAEMLDFVSYDNYPVWGGLEQPISPAEIALGLDVMRGLKQKNFWIVEQLIGAQGHNIIGYLPRPNQAKMWSYQAFARGCSNMLYFNWKAMTKGAEQFCMGIIDHDNVQGQKFNEVKSLFNEIKPYSELLESDIHSDVAVLYDFDNIWSWRLQRQSEQFDYKTHLLSLYEPFYKRNIMTDVIPLSRAFEKYKVVVLPSQQIITEDVAIRLEQFVENGGILILGYRAGLRNRDNNIHYNKQFPAHLTKIVGAVVKGVEAVPNSHQIFIKDEANEKQYQCTVWRDLLEATTAQTLYYYDDEFYPYSAVTCNDYANGQVYYMGGQFESTIIDSIVELAVKKAKLLTLESSEGIEIVERTYKNDQTYFVMNHTMEKKFWRNHEIKPFETLIVSKN